MNNGAELIEALSQIVRDKKIDKKIVFEAIEISLISACKKNYGATAEFKIDIDETTGTVKVYQQKTVVEEVEDELCQISLQDAKLILPEYSVGDVINNEVAPKNFGRVSAQNAKQMVVQRFREAEREVLYNEYASKLHTIITGVIQRREHRNIIIGLGNIEAVLTQNEQVYKEIYTPQDRIKVFVLDVKSTGKGPSILVSRSTPLLVKKMFEQEVPEIYDGIVEIKSIAREAGIRSKIAVYSENPNVDPVGACVGPSGNRVNFVINELKGEKIDIVRWSDNPAEYISSALSPSRVEFVAINPYDMTAKIIVQDNQLSLAIGKEGQNARLAAKLTGWRIDIKSETQAEEIGFITQEELDLDYTLFLEEKARLEARNIDFDEVEDYEKDENEQSTSSYDAVLNYDDADYANRYAQPGYETDSVDFNNDDSTNIIVDEITAHDDIGRSEQIRRKKQAAQMVQEEQQGDQI
ncbi:MAG: transcription termination factor NusA [Firmicutes bacterium]|nr:transcription termination factor NusA [Bacillota bacterium]